MAPPGLRLLIVALVASASIAAAPALASHGEAPPEGSVIIGFASDAQESGDRPLLRNIVSVLQSHNATHLLYGGDTTYGYEAPPDDWVDALGPYSDPSRLLFVYGNHDKWGTYASFTAPDSPGGTWFSREVNGYLILGIHSLHGISPGTPQWNWLVSTLENRGDRPVIIATHVSWWVPNIHDASLAFNGNATALDALLDRHDVRLALGGHGHYYARQVRGNMTYVSAGAAEAHLRDVPGAVTNNSVKSGKFATYLLLELGPAGINVTAMDPRNNSPFDGFGVYGLADVRPPDPGTNPTGPTGPSPTGPGDDNGGARGFDLLDYAPPFIIGTGVGAILVSAPRKWFDGWLKLKKRP